MSQAEMQNQELPHGKSLEFNTVPADIARGISYHKKAAQHYELAAKYHREAAKEHELGEHDKAALCTLIANGHQTLALDHQREAVKNQDVIE